MFNWTRRTFREARTFSRTLEREVFVWKFIAQFTVYLACIFASGVTCHLIPGVTVWTAIGIGVGYAVAALFLCGVALPMLHFLGCFGKNWETDPYTEVRKSWWNRLDHISEPVKIRDLELPYVPSKDVYDVGFYMSRDIVLDLQMLAASYDTDLAGVVDNALGLLKLQDEARRLNTEMLLSVRTDQRLTKQMEKTS